MEQKLALKQRPAISQLTSAVFDNGRRGMPRPGCDCMQCFGYCDVDHDRAVRESFARSADKRPVEDDAPITGA